MEDLIYMKFIDIESTREVKGQRNVGIKNKYLIGGVCSKNTASKMFG